MRRFVSLLTLVSLQLNLLPAEIIAPRSYESEIAIVGSGTSLCFNKGSPEEISINRDTFLEIYAALRNSSEEIKTLKEEVNALKGTINV